MKKVIIKFAPIAVFVCCSSVVNADKGVDMDKQLEHGKNMHNEHCYKCHTDEVYTRDNSFVKSLNALGKQVVRCKDNTGAPWFDEDTDAVVNFLNEKYYKF